MLTALVILFLLISVFFIWKGSDWITDSLVPVAHRLGTSYIAVTTLLVSLVLSLPEIFTATYSYLLGHLTLGLGVIIGSVMLNIGLTVGLSAAFKPLKVEKPVAIRDGVFLVIVVLVVLLFGSDLSYTRTEGLVLLLLFAPYALNVWYFERGRTHKSRKEKVKQVKQNLVLVGHTHFLKLKPSLLTFLIGAMMLVGGSYLFSFSLVRFSQMLPIPEILIGLIFGALGTGMPNIIAAFQGTRRGYEDAAITETFGSNIFTLLVTLGAIIILQPFMIVGKLFYFDLTWMIIIHLLFVAFIFKGYHYREESLTRYEGIALVLFYLTLIIINAAWF